MNVRNVGKPFIFMKRGMALMKFSSECKEVAVGFRSGCVDITNRERRVCGIKAVPLDEFGEKPQNGLFRKFWPSGTGWYLTLAADRLLRGWVPRLSNGS
jgi:hypothetical protein